VLDFYPPAARAAGVNGVAVVRCARTEHGEFVNCTLVSETPKNQGFGAAALSFAAHATACPSLSLPLSERQPHSFTFGFSTSPTLTLIEPNVVKAARSATHLVQRPLPADVAAAYPRKAREARVSGRAAILCSANPSGDIVACALAYEEPAGYGFGKAAMNMGYMFKAAPQPPSRCAYAPSVVIIPIEWKSE
jgi:hypothetical protein